MKQSIGSQPGGPISAVSQWLSIFMTNSDHPTVHLAVVNTEGRRGMAKPHHADTQSCHSPFVHLCLKSEANGVEGTFPRPIPRKWYILFSFVQLTELIKLFYGQLHFIIRESIHLCLIFLSGQSLSSPSVSQSLSVHTLIKKKNKNSRTVSSI